MKNVGILLFNEVEVMDFAGPFEVFSLSEDDDMNKLYKTFTVSQNDEVISARNGFLAKAMCTFDTCPHIDILIVPGGYGAEKIEIHNAVLLDWIAETSRNTKITASVCTGAFLLAKSRVLTSEKVTTHWMDQGDLQKRYPALTVVSGEKFIDNGKILTSGGISAGIVMSLHIVSKINGRAVAERTAKRMEYDWP